MTNCDCSDKKPLCTLRPSPSDLRDYRYESLRFPGSGPRLNSTGTSSFPPKTLDLRKYMKPVRNQGSRGTCAAFSAAAAKEYQEHLDNTTFQEYISPDSIYLQRINQDSEGMFGRDVMRILQKGGACRESLIPYNGTVDPSEIPEEAKAEMPHYCIRKYARVETIEGTKQALFECGPLLICMPFYNNGLAEFWRAPSMDSQLDGGHAVTIVGYNEKGFILRNSWGYKWNGDGHVVFPYEDFGMEWEIWCMVDEETAYLPPHLDPNSDEYVPEPTNWLKVLARCGCCCKDNNGN